MQRRSHDVSDSELGKRFAGYQVYDRHYEKVGKIAGLFVNERDKPEYIGVKMGFLGTRFTLLPMDIVRVNDRRGLVEASVEKHAIENAPVFDDDEGITPEIELEVRQYYGLESSGYEQQGAYGAYYATEPGATETGGDPEVDLYSGERATSQEVFPEVSAGGVEFREPDERVLRDRDHPRRRSGAEEVEKIDTGTRAREHDNDNELRVQRAEEELWAGTRERELGSVNVRKRVRTDRAQDRVPKKREEISVERVPTEGRTTEGQSGGRRSAERRAAKAEIDDGGIRIPIIEEEVVTEKRPVVKEEIRVRKDVVEEDEVVEEDVRKEEVEVDEETRRGS